MANPLYKAFVGGNKPAQPANIQDALRQLQSNPAQMIRNAGYNVPDEIINNPQATVMHLLQTGQIGGPMMQRIQPMLSQLLGRK